MVIYNNGCMSFKQLEGAAQWEILEINIKTVA